MRQPGQCPVIHVERTELTKRPVSALAEERSSAVVTLSVGNGLLLAVGERRAKRSSGNDRPVLGKQSRVPHRRRAGPRRGQARHVLIAGGPAWESLAAAQRQASVHEAPKTMCAKRVIQSRVAMNHGNSAVNPYMFKA